MPEFKNANSRILCSNVSKTNVISPKVSSAGIKLTSVPCSSSLHSPIFVKCFVVVPFANSTSYTPPFFHIFVFSHTDSALTTDTPTPCKPPDILYEFLLNLPPACSCVMITSAAETPSSG